MEASAGGEKWWRLELVLRGGGDLSCWCHLLEVRASGVRWWMFQLVARGGVGLSWCYEVEQE